MSKMRRSVRPELVIPRIGRRLSHADGGDHVVFLVTRADIANVAIARESLGSTTWSS